MCGIALILAGFRILGSDPFRESSGDPAAIPEEVNELVIPVDDFKAALLRRGPDNLGSKTLFFHSEQKISVVNDGSEDDKKDDLCLGVRESVKDCLNSALKAVSAEGQSTIGTHSFAKLDLLGATLQLRGKCPIFQPLQDFLGNILAYNGEIFGGINVAADGNDAETLLYALERCCSHDCGQPEMPHPHINPGENSVPEVLSSIKGPWALVYWQERSKTIWFGRDAFGRRSLLVHWPTFEDPRFVLSSVSPPSFGRKDYECMPSYWEELPCGIFSIHLKASKTNAHGREERPVGEVRKHEWTDPLLDKLIRWERTFVDPKLNGVSLDDFPSRKGLLPFWKRVHNDNDTGYIGDHMRMDTKLEAETSVLLRDLAQVSPMIGYSQPALKVLVSLKESVMRRITLSSMVQMILHQCDDEPAPVAVLFSGGLDSMILAALLDQCLNPNYAVDLLNVSFDGNLAPDRISARDGVRELQRIAPHRRWRLVEIDASLSSLIQETKHVKSLIHPSRTYMDLNIGMALWLAAGGEGSVDGEICNHFQKGTGHYKYKSASRILLVGSGADEQCAGYGRHRTKYRLGSWFALQEEMKLDMQRIWKRNLGRDDRCISDHGKEARFPFLDEDVIRTLLEIPLWEIAELDEPIGRGDKKILREVAGFLGLEGAALLPKRAIQFGTRIARESNRKNFGSNRAANQASAGSVEIHEARS